MKQHEQVAMLKRLLALRETRRDEAMLDEVVRIPISKYTDQALLDQELASTFTRYPLVAGHVSALSEPGSYIASDWDQFPYFVIRGEDGRIRAFYNQCRHRGARLLDQCAGSRQEPHLPIPRLGLRTRRSTQGNHAFARLPRSRQGRLWTRRAAGRGSGRFRLGRARSRRIVEHSRVPR